MCLSLGVTPPRPAAMTDDDFDDSGSGKVQINEMAFWQWLLEDDNEYRGFDDDVVRRGHTVGGHTHGTGTTSRCKAHKQPLCFAQYVTYYKPVTNYVFTILFREFWCAAMANQTWAYPSWAVLSGCGGEFTVAKHSPGAVQFVRRSDVALPRVGALSLAPRRNGASAR